ncbi:MAG: zinc-ribbon domain-containing protein, partial [Myxococcales bacterium]|nr:zinc-ribbon domain-containing protein [Myxococcales bacterium]
MIVTCPACSARYNVKESKIQGRGAKITCPRCAHRFVVYREEEGGAPPDNVPQLDFAEVGITWRVRKGAGKHTYDFRDLATLREMQQDGQVDRWDQISWDGHEWTPIESIPSLEAYFYDIFVRARAGELQIPEYDEDASEEDDSDAPTTIVGRGSSLASEIRQAVADAATPSPSPGRSYESNTPGVLLHDDDDAPEHFHESEEDGDPAPEMLIPTEAPSPVRRSTPSAPPPEPLTPIAPRPTPSPQPAPLGGAAAPEPPPPAIAPPQMVTPSPSVKPPAPPPLAASSDSGGSGRM